MITVFTGADDSGDGWQLKWEGEECYIKWVPPIRDEETLRKYKECLKKMDEKYYIMFEIGVGTGMMLQELLKLKNRDVQGRDFIEVYVGIKQVKRTFVFSDELKKEIRDYTGGKDPEGWLFTGRTDSTEPLSREQAYRALKAAGRKVGLSSIGAQTMRKTFAWRYYKETGDITYLQELMNHGSVSITYRYIGEKPRTEVKFKNMSAEENERSRLMLLTDDNGKNQIEDIIAVLRALCGELENSGKNDAFYGNTDCFLTELEELVQSYSEGQV